MKILYSLLLSILLLSVVSAQIGLSPSTLSIPSYPGEVHYRNITITTDGNYTVYLTSQSSGNITINYNSTSPVIVEKQKTIEVAFTFPTDIVPGVYDINLTGSIDAYVDTPVIVVNEVRGGGGLVYRNITKEVVVTNAEDKARIQELEKENTELKKVPEEKKPLALKEVLAIAFTFFAIFVMLALFIYYIVNKKVKK